MKRALKIIGWTLFSLVMLVVIAVVVACYFIFTPERLTPVVRDVAGKFITCEYEIGEVELTFFSTFPRVGLRADGLLLLNPMPGAQNDTVVEAKHLTATVDVMQFLKHNNLIVHEAILDDASVNYYTALDGTTNLDVFVMSPDSTEEDTTAFSLPFNELRVDGLRIKANTITYLNDKDTMSASMGVTELAASASNWNDMHLTLNANDVCASIKNETYADSMHIALDAPVKLNLDSMYFAFDEAELALNEFDLALDGDIRLGDTIDLNMRLTTGKWQIVPLLALVPETFTQSLKDLDVDGKVQLQADIQGSYSETQIPLVMAHLTLEDGKGSYKPLPYTLRDLALDANAVLNLNEGQTSDITINNMAAKTKKSQLAAKGQVNDFSGDMFLDLQMTLDANLPDFKYFMPDSMNLTGRTKGTAAVKIKLADLTEMRLEKGRINADLTLTDIRFEQDSMLAVLPSTKAKIQIPNSKPSKKSVNWARVDLKAAKVDFEMGKSLNAFIDEPDMRIEVANILANGQDYFAYIDLDALDGQFDDILADLKKTQLEAFVSGGKKVSAKIHTQALNGKMGEELSAKTDSLVLEAAARYNEKEENILLKWNPRLKIQLTNGEFNLPERLPEAVIVPSIDFQYSNRNMTIDNSRIELGNSDLNIKGYVHNIGKWFRHDTILEGQLDIVSNHCDANQLLAWFSADSGSEEQPEEKDKNDQMSNDKSQMSNDKSQMTNDSDKESGPFLVPTDVNLALNTHMQEVVAFNQIAKDLKGGIYLNDGTLTLDEVGFVCRAAKLQLTAMYRSPRRNHLYLGMDYHMVDVDIDELLTMIPNLEQMVPMLSSFKGAAQFHLAAETYLNSQYKPKMSTLRGAASLTGKDLVVLDGETFSQISKLLMFNKKTENKIDSINAEITVYKNEIDVYPLCVQMDNYMVALGGRHNTDMTFDYDINVLKPIYLGVNVSGNIDNLKIKLAKCKFAQDFRPHWYQKADNQSRELRERIKQSMEKNVRIK